MFCPSCGMEERQASQFCRACGTDVRVVRTALQKPDSITASAVGARDEIGRALAAKIQTIQSAGDLKKIVEDVLPEIEKFLESPEERRLRRLRAGVVSAAIGLGAMILMLVKTVPLPPLVFLGWPAGLIVFLIGLGVVINGLLFSVPSKQVADHSLEARAQSMLEIANNNSVSTGPIVTGPIVTGEVAAKFIAPPPSVTEHTTRQLPNELSRQPKNTTAE
jgi:hypothetical protein